MPVTAATYLGDNTVVALAEIAAALGERGIDIEVIADDRTSDDAHRRAAETDLVWMCGALYAAMDRGGELDHDVVAAPVFTGETAPRYHSVIVSRPDGVATVDEALAGTVAVNEPASWSGHHALRHHVAPRWFAGEITTGSHTASLRAIADGRADCAAIDHSIWDAELRAGHSITDRLRVIDRTTDWPAPPLLVRRGLDRPTRDSIADALLDLGPLTGITSLEPATATDYRVMM